MIKNRSFLFGLGSGLIAGALLLQLMISGGAAPLTKEQILQGAARLNLTVSDSVTEPPSDETQNNSVDKGNDGEEVTDENTEAIVPSEPISAASPSPAASPEVPVTTNKTSSPTKPKQPSKPANEEVEKPEVTTAPSAVAPKVQEVTQNGKYSVHIPNGSTLNETANILAKAGAIKDKDLFLKTAKGRKINTIIQSGSYSFDEDEKIDSIIDKLITLK